MDVLISVAGVSMVIGVILIIRLRSRPGRGTMEQKLELLASCGLSLADPFKPEDLLTSWSREEYEEPVFYTVLTGLGITEEQEPWRHHCVNLWHFDAECIEDPGDYKRIVERMAQMTQGSLLLENIRDHVDVVKEEAWFSFSFQGRDVKVDCEVNYDWVDTNIFITFVELLAVTDSSKVFIYLDLGGQHCIIGCVTKDNLKKLRSHGIKFVPLT